MSILPKDNEEIQKKLDFVHKQGDPFARRRDETTGRIKPLPEQSPEQHVEQPLCNNCLRELDRSIHVSELLSVLEDTMSKEWPNGAPMSWSSFHSELTNMGVDSIVALDRCDCHKDDVLPF